MNFYQKIILFLLLLSCFGFSNNKYTECKNESLYVECDNGNTYDGYFWHSRWVPGLIDFSQQFLLYPPLSEGSLVFYNPGQMEATAKYRGLSLKGYDGGVATITCGNIGNRVWIKFPSGEWKIFRVVDCGRRNDIYGIINFRNEVIEVDFQTALSLKMVSNYNIKTSTYTVLKWKLDNILVSMINPKWDSPEIKPVLLKDWFNKNIVYATKNSDRKTCPLIYYPSLFDEFMPTWRIKCVYRLFPNN